MKTFFDYCLYVLLIIFLAPVYLILGVLWVISGIGMIIFTLVSALIGVLNDTLYTYRKKIRRRKYERDHIASTFVYKEEEASLDETN